MKSRLASVVGFIIWGGVAAPLAAHPGHGRDADTSGVAHYLSEPLHALGLLALCGAVVLLRLWAGTCSRTAHRVKMSPRR